MQLQQTIGIATYGPHNKNVVRHYFLEHEQWSSVVYCEEFPSGYREDTISSSYNRRYFFVDMHNPNFHMTFPQC